MSKLDWAKALAGEGASNEELVKWLYKLDKNEFEMWWGPTKPFPSFWEWLVEQVRREANPEKSSEQEAGGMMTDPRNEYVFNVDVWLLAESYAEAQELADEILKEISLREEVTAVEREHVEYM